MTKLNELLAELNNEAKRIKKHVLKIHMKEESTLKLDYFVFVDPNATAQDFNKSRNSDIDMPTSKRSEWINKGVYLFISNEDFRIEFPDFNLVNTPPVNRLINNKYIDIKKNDMFYLGKSYDMKTRLRCHCNNTLSDKSYSLKLNNKNRSFCLDKLSIYTFRLKYEYKEYYALIIPSVEKKLHDLCKPWFGSERV